MRPIIHTIKHYSHTAVVVVASGSLNQITIANAIVKGAARTNAFDVEEGSIIKAVYLEYWISGVTLDKTATWVFLKRPAGVTSPTFAQMANLGSYPNKKNIFSSGQGLAPTGGNILPVFKEWFKIPKGKQRMGLGDILQINVAAVGTNVNVCGLTTYKEQE